MSSMQKIIEMIHRYYDELRIVHVIWYKNEYMSIYNPGEPDIKKMQPSILLRIDE